MMTDPIADMLTRIRNAVMVRKAQVDVPASKLAQGIVDVLKREGYIWDYEVVEQKPQNILRIQLKYGPNGEKVIQHLRRISKPGRRIYAGVDEIPNVLDGLGICILTTNQGILSDREARRKNVGGEVLCEVW